MLGDLQAGPSRMAAECFRAGLLYMASAEWILGGRAQPCFMSGRKAEKTDPQTGFKVA